MARCSVFYVQLYTQLFSRDSWSNASFPRCIRGTALSVLCSCVSQNFVIKSLWEAHYKKHTVNILFIIHYWSKCLITLAKKNKLLCSLLIAQFFSVEGNSRAKEGNLMIESRRRGVATAFFICSIRFDVWRPWMLFSRLLPQFLRPWFIPYSPHVITPRFSTKTFLYAGL